MERIIAGSIKLDNLIVPPFVLNAGEYLSMDFPDIYDPVEENRLIQILTGASPVSSVQSDQRMETVSLDLNYSVLDKLFGRHKVGRFLRKVLSSDLKINELLKVASINPETPVAHLSANARKMLALEILRMSGRKHVIINCSDLDYNGLYRLKPRIVSLLNTGGSVIELNYPSSHGRQHVIDERDFPVVHHLSLIRKEP